MVNLVRGGQRAIEDLKVGDRIWTLNHRGTALFQDQVILMMDNGPNKTGQFFLLIDHTFFILLHLCSSLLYIQNETRQ